MRDFNLLKESVLLPFSQNIKNNCFPFKCGDDDLDEFFDQDALLYEKELLGKTYCWINSNNPKEIFAMITLSFNGINLIRLDKSSKNSFQRKIPNPKRHISYPGVLIGRLGVNINFRNKGYNIGTQIINFLKDWFIDSSNKAACRFIIVDAYNNDATLNFYFKNGFNLLYKSEDKEKEAYGIGDSESLNSRILFFDLKLSL